MQDGAVPAAWRDRFLEVDVWVVQVGSLPT